MDFHALTWALEMGVPFDEVDDADANYHGLCGLCHGPNECEMENK